MCIRFGTARVCAFCAQVLLMLAASPAARADETCVAPGVTPSLASCGAGSAALAPTPRTSKLAFSSPPASPKRNVAFGAADVPTATEVRRRLASVRSVQLLITQIQGLESLLTSTPADSTARADLLRRLGDSYVELETGSFQKKTEARIAALDQKPKDPTKASALAAEGDRLEKVEGLARKTAIKHYGELAARFPTWCQNTIPTARAGCLDETLYNLAYEYEQAGDLTSARKAYYEIIQKAPTSKYIPKAYLAFGELFFQEAQGDPAKWALAEQSYKEVVKYPPPENSAFGYAHYKLGHVHWNKGDAVNALAEFKRTIDYGVQFPAAPGAAALATSARRDILPIYAQAGTPAKAHDFFKPLSGDAGGESQRTLRLLEDLGRNYLDVGHYADAAVLYRDLIRRFPGNKSCEYQARLTEAVLAQRTGDKAASKAALDQLLESEDRFVKGASPVRDKHSCANDTAAIVTETAMMWHLEAAGSGGVRGTQDPKTRALAADLYDRLIRQFTAADFAGFEFPRLVREDWPTLLKVKVSRADLLYSEQNWKQCGPAFDAVVTEDPKGPEANEASYASALCHQKAYLAAHGGTARATGSTHGSAEEALAPRALSEDEHRMMASFDRFLCLFKPAPKDKDAYERYVDVAYARARTWFDAHHFAEAAVAFGQIALEYADSDAGIDAAELHLEALNVLSARNKAACHEQMGRSTARLLGLYCTGTGSKAASLGDHCTGLQRVKVDVARLHAQDLVASAGDGTSLESARRLEDGANLYLALWNEDGRKACEAKQPSCKGMEEVLYNAAIAFQRARLLGRAIGVRKLLLDPRLGLDRTPVALRAMNEIGKNYQAMAVYDEAAAWYERFARENPTAKDAPAALQDAILLRLGLGQEEAAVQDAERFEKSWGAEQKALSAHIAFAIGAHDVDHGDFDKAVQRLSKSLRDIDKNGAIDIRIQAHALLGHALVSKQNLPAAGREFGRVIELFRDPQRVIGIVDKSDGEAAQQRRVAKLLTAVGEATFFFAEQKRRTADGIRFPAYTGSGLRADVLHHVHTRVKEWMQAKRRAIEEAEAEYVKILAIDPPPPRWVIAAGARTGHLWGKFVAEFRAAPIPKEWQQNGPSPYGGLTWEEIRAAYYEAIDTASEPYRQHAKTAFKKCLSYSVAYQYSDEYSRSCETWLARNYATEYHVIDELRGSPTRTPSFMPAAPLAALR